MGAYSFDFPDSKEDGDLVKNKKAKDITFIKKNGRISLRMGSRKVGGSNMVSGRLDEMKSEISSADAGHTITTMKDMGSKGTAFKRHGIKSTFPSWFGESGFNSKKDFLKVINSKKGKRYDRLIDRAIDDLSGGYSTSFGKVPASKEFQVKSRQKFDNKGVVFRVIKGKVRPIRGGSQRFDDEVPF